MNPNKLNYICDCVEDAFQKVANQIAKLQFTRNDQRLTNSDGKKYLVVVGLLGLNNDDPF